MATHFPTQKKLCGLLNDHQPLKQCKNPKLLTELDNAAISASILCVHDSDGTGMTRKNIRKFYTASLSLLTPEQQADLPNWAAYNSDSTVALYTYRRLQWLYHHLKDWQPLPEAN